MNAKHNLLLVNKTILTTVWLKKHLKDAFHVIHVKTCEEALIKLQNTVIDFVIIDEDVNDIPPLNLASKIRHSLSSSWVPILLLTSNLKNSFRKKALNAGISDFLSDPPEEQELEKHIASSLKARSMHKKIHDVSKTLKAKEQNSLSQNMISSQFLLHDHAIKEVDRARKEKKPLTLALIGIDSYKAIEKTCNVLDLNRLLFSLSDVITQEIRKEDILIPSKDGKFIVIMPNLTIQQARIEAASLMKKMKAAQFQAKGKPITISISVVLTTQDKMPKENSEDQYERMIDHADKAMKKIEKETSKLVSLKGNSD